MSEIIDAKRIAQNVQAALDELRPIIDDISQVQPSKLGPNFVSSIVFRGIVRRQHDAMVATVQMALADHGYAGVAFLRPACEELVWVRIFKTLKPEVIEQLLICLMSVEGSQALEAQEEFTETEIMRGWGFITASKIQNAENTGRGRTPTN